MFLARTAASTVALDRFDFLGRAFQIVGDEATHFVDAAVIVDIRPNKVGRPVLPAPRWEALRVACPP